MNNVPLSTGSKLTERSIDDHVTVILGIVSELPKDEPARARLGDAVDNIAQAMDALCDLDEGAHVPQLRIDYLNDALESLRRFAWDVELLAMQVRREMVESDEQRVLHVHGMGGL